MLVCFILNELKLNWSIILYFLLLGEIIIAHYIIELFEPFSTVVLTNILKRSSRWGPPSPVYRPYKCRNLHRRSQQWEIFEFDVVESSLAFPRRLITFLISGSALYFLGTSSFHACVVLHFSLRTSTISEISSVLPPALLRTEKEATENVRSIINPL